MTVDATRRVPVPTKYIKVLSQYYSSNCQNLIALPGSENPDPSDSDRTPIPVVRLLPVPEFQKFCKEEYAKNQDLADVFIALEELSIDKRTGRIRLSEGFMEHLDLPLGKSGTVRFVGISERMELYSDAGYQRRLIRAQVKSNAYALRIKSGGLLVEAELNAGSNSGSDS
jgi:DNA-binding transcriptional regulator/RsmH inhibitor MraZ